MTNVARTGVRNAESPASITMQRVLLIEDDHDIAGLVSLHLRDLNLQVTAIDDGCRGLARALADNWQLIVLDLSLPNMDGLDICRRLRDRGHYTPILMLTARDTEAERILGFDVGADDYLAKPFSVVELAARVRAILRRVAQLRATSHDKTPQSACLGELFIDFEARHALRGNEPLTLTAREFDLLAHFVGHPGKVFSRAQLLDQVWGMSHDAYEHTVSSHINRLRAKLEPNPTAPRYLHTVWGIGYRFAEP